jgi:hypothetical protein
MNKRLNRALRRAILSLSVIPGAVEESLNRERGFGGCLTIARHETFLICDH